MSGSKNSQLILRAVALLAIVVGILNLLGVRPMNSRTIEVVLGAAALVTGVALLVVTMRTKPAGTPTSVA